MTQTSREGIPVIALTIALMFAGKYQIAASQQLAATQTTHGDSAQDLRDTAGPRNVGPIRARRGKDRRCVGSAGHSARMRHGRGD